MVLPGPQYQNNSAWGFAIEFPFGSNSGLKRTMVREKPRIQTFSHPLFGLPRAYAQMHDGRRPKNLPVLKSWASPSVPILVRQFPPPLVYVGTRAHLGAASRCRRRTVATMDNLAEGVKQ